MYTPTPHSAPLPLSCKRCKYMNFKLSHDSCGEPKSAQTAIHPRHILHLCLRKPCNNLFFKISKHLLARLDGGSERCTPAPHSTPPALPGPANIWTSSLPTLLAVTRRLLRTPHTCISCAFERPRPINHLQFKFGITGRGNTSLCIDVSAHSGTVSSQPNEPPKQSESWSERACATNNKQQTTNASSLTTTAHS